MTELLDTLWEKTKKDANMPVAQTQNTDLSIGLLAGQAQLIEFPVAGRSGPEPTQLPSDCVSVCQRPPTGLQIKTG